MYAITVSPPGGPDNLDWTEIPTPSPEPGEVLVRTVAAGVNRADVLQRQGHYPPPAGVSDIIGLEASGVVEKVGAGVTRWKPGDEVVALLAGGGYAEYFTAPEGQLIPPPPGVDLVSAAGVIEVAATVVSNLDHVRLAEGETFLVHGGAGGVGSFAIQYAQAQGAGLVLTTAGTAEKLAYCKELGADIALDYHEDWADAVQVATNDRGADVILDILGAGYLEDNVNSLAIGGRLVIIGMQKGVKGTLNIGRLLNKRATVTATSLRFRPVDQKAAICAQVEQQVWPLIANGTIKLAPETRFSLKDAPAAHRQLESGANIGKILLVAH
jgi:putative PIG3 family NAD(P)H quinone oxidoreductase